MGTAKRLGWTRRARYDVRRLTICHATPRGSVGDCYDSALCESFFATLECELLDRRSLQNRSQARLALFDYIEGFYNRSRRHSALGYLSPAEYERRRKPVEVA